MRTAQNELENEPYMLGKLQMSIFWSILRIVKIIFLEEVMGILVREGQESTWGRNRRTAARMTHGMDE